MMSLCLLVIVVVPVHITIEALIKFIESGLTAFSIHSNVVKIAVPRNGGHFERRAAIGRRNTLLNSYVAISRAL